MYSLARILAGHFEDKKWFINKGSRNSGKGVITSLLQNAFWVLNIEILTSFSSGRRQEARQGSIYVNMWGFLDDAKKLGRIFPTHTRSHWRRNHIFIHSYSESFQCDFCSESLQYAWICRNLFKFRLCVCVCVCVCLLQLANAPVSRFLTSSRYTRPSDRCLHWFSLFIFPRDLWHNILLTTILPSLFHQIPLPMLPLTVDYRWTLPADMPFTASPLVRPNRCPSSLS